MSYWIAVAVTGVAVVICVVLHYEALRVIPHWLPTPRHRHRRRIVFLILCLLVVYSVERWVLGLANYGLLQFDRFGQLAGMDDVTIFNCVYYSAVVFSTLGFGDIVPDGPIRFLTGMETIAGLTFITWSASFTILDMIKTWDDGELDVDRDGG